MCKALSSVGDWYHQVMMGKTIPNCVQVTTQKSVVMVMMTTHVVLLGKTLHLYKVRKVALQETTMGSRGRMMTKMTSAYLQ